MKNQNNMKKLAITLTLLVLVVFTTNCKRDNNKGNDTPTPSSATTTNFEISYEVDGKALSPDTMIYKNPFGVPYSVSRLQYFISKIKLYKTDGSVWSPDSDYFYMDGLKYLMYKLPLGKVPAGEYNKIEFYIGLPPELNKHGAIANTQENIDMEWPTMMGGGYHFIKFEGSYKVHPDSMKKGFAVHLGTNSALVSVTINLQTPIKISGDQEINIPLVMNLNEWFRNPHDYNFATQKAYTMNDSLARATIAQNGQDVFYYKK